MGVGSSLCERLGRRSPCSITGCISQARRFAALVLFCRASQSLLQAEKKALQARCMELEAVLRHKQEELCGQLAEQQQVSQHWKDRWNQVAVALKTKEEELEQAHVAHQSLSAKVGHGQ